MQLLLIAPVWILVLAVIGGLFTLSAIGYICFVVLHRSSKTYVPDFTQMAIDIIREERIEQITKHGFMSDRDDRYKNDELAVAASCYIYAPKYKFNIAVGNEAPIQWPWSKKWNPSGGRMKQLQKGGGLLLAEIERQLRKQWYELKKSEYAIQSGAANTANIKGTDIHARRKGSSGIL